MSAYNDIINDFNGIALQHSLHIDNVVADGEIHRFKDRHRGDHNENGYYALHMDGNLRYAWGCIGHWSMKTGRIEESYVWYDRDQNVTEIEKRHIHDLIKKSKREVHAKIEVDRRDALKEIENIWQSAIRIDKDFTHQYLDKKKIEHTLDIKILIDEHGTKRLVIPIITSFKKREKKSLQYIFEDGSKRFCKNTSPKDGFFVLGQTSNNSMVCICEGYATGVSLYQSLGWKTIVAFSAENLVSVARTVRREINPHLLIICADNDAHKDINIGIEKAKEAAKEGRAIVVYPMFRDISTLPTDFNDLYVLEGSDAVKAHFIEHLPLKSYSWEEYEKKTFSPSFQLMEPWLENGTLNMIYSQPGVGKSWLCLHIAFSLASGRSMEALNWTVKKKCKVLYIDSELKGDKLQKYIKQIGGDNWTFETKRNLMLMDWESLRNSTIDSDFFNPAWRSLFETNAIMTGKPDVIIIDNVLKLFGGNLNERKDWSIVNRWFDFWMAKGITFVLVHHTGKYTGQYMGTQGIMASMSTSLILSKHEKYGDEEVYTSASFLLECTKDRYAEKKIHSYNVTIRTDRERDISVIDAEIATKAIKDQIVDIFNEEPTTYNKIADKLNEGKAKKIDSAYICKCLKTAYENGLITRDIAGWESFKIPKPKNK
ncbi:AAA family ATPase [bacterium]|nr:AAA family ATPase [bacterium]